MSKIPFSSKLMSAGEIIGVQKRYKLTDVTNNVHDIPDVVINYLKI